MDASYLVYEVSIHMYVDMPGSFFCELLCGGLRDACACETAVIVSVLSMPKALRSLDTLLRTFARRE